MLAKPNERDVLYLYVEVTNEVAISAVLVNEEDNIQKSVYYTNKVLHGAEIKYKKVEKFVFTLFVIARKLRSYF